VSGVCKCHSPPLYWEKLTALPQIPNLIGYLAHAAEKRGEKGMKRGKRIGRQGRRVGRKTPQKLI